jgi:hypothetical protein
MLGDVDMLQGAPVTDCYGSTLAITCYGNLYGNRSTGVSLAFAYQLARDYQSS